ncbi:UDP-N-acetylmuramoyl-L-alanyl-D-glutamate--2, 6-diaminopimelate ligase / UDP-N-acetylmuramoyl-tripeptide--D-alanyl-D-alanine ligase (fragment) [Candidatus Desulfarcum epimagneticum]|uniref:UDP-N-acetylmuramoyl-tripeptide--D-alanyl-D-alanine ligase n=1 Tax=uncultured Desulfobacteraceae bacterium TaxID=218296 RepID=A0A484HJB6_9BACT
MEQTPEWTLEEIIKGSRGERICGDLESVFAGVSIDSRSLRPDDLFVAVKGESHDGHAFLSRAEEKGARGFLIKEGGAKAPVLEKWRRKGLAAAAVSDTTRALGALGAFNLARSGASVVAVTGSNGKTTTRNMTAAIARRRFRTLATAGNMNNHIGLPLTLLKLSRRHEWAVLEMGMNHPGEIGYLAGLCRPAVGVITNTGPAHLEGVGSLEGVAHAKGELLENLQPGGWAVLNADDPRVDILAEKAGEKVLYFGLSKTAAVRAGSIKKKGSAFSFDLALPGESLRVRLNVPGRFMIANALAAAGAAHLMGISGEDIRTGLEDFRPEPGRMSVRKAGEISVVDDTYNANPASVAAAISALGELAGAGGKFFVLGDMMELGERAESMHREAGLAVAKAGAEGLCVSGRFAAAAAGGAREGGLDPGRIFRGTRDEIAAYIKKSLKPGDWVLVKGSRAAGMERVVEKLLETDPKKTDIKAD